MATVNRHTHLPTKITHNPAAVPGPARPRGAKRKSAAFYQSPYIRELFTNSGACSRKSIKPPIKIPHGGFRWVGPRLDNIQTAISTRHFDLPLLPTVVDGMEDEPDRTGKENEGHDLMARVSGFLGIVVGGNGGGSERGPRFARALCLISHLMSLVGSSDRPWILSTASPCFSSCPVPGISPE